MKTKIEVGQVYKQKEDKKREYLEETLTITYVCLDAEDEPWFKAKEVDKSYVISLLDAFYYLSI